MKRSGPMKRTPMKRGTQLSPEEIVRRYMKRKRLAPVSKKTLSVRWPVLKALRAHVLERAKGRCERCGGKVRLDIHHVLRRSAGGPDIPSNAVALCRPCHNETDYAYKQGRLVITPLGGELFRFERIYASSKWVARL